MPITEILMGAGMPAGLAQAVVGDCGLGLTAAGSSQTTAYQILSPQNVFGTVGASAGAILQSSLSPGDEVKVYNGGAHTLTVYPPVGGAINGGSVNAGVSVSVNSLTRFTCIDHASLNFATG